MQLTLIAARAALKYSSATYSSVPSSPVTARASESISCGGGGYLDVKLHLDREEGTHPQGTTRTRRLNGKLRKIVASLVDHVWNVIPTTGGVVGTVLGALDAHDTGPGIAAEPIEERPS
jgi:hypothetical protein